MVLAFNVSRRLKFGPANTSLWSKYNPYSINRKWCRFNEKIEQQYDRTYIHQLISKNVCWFLVAKEWLKISFDMIYELALLFLTIVCRQIGPSGGLTSIHEKKRTYLQGYCKPKWWTRNGCFKVAQEKLARWPGRPCHRVNTSKIKRLEFL